ncbi:MAG: GH92 family glycosyl hydrolase [Bacteroidales bacterium]|nr:GH92 family glycosyl hydrolase [Bacteroidales bacterium]MCI1786259.1 GH92 family glycosyl hydrolase [Bacteroidales bacterium]
MGRQHPEPVDYVNTLAGTESSYEISAGNTYPAVALPWGMNFWTPQTGKSESGWIYTYTANKIKGIRQTHQPSPWINDYGTFSIMPVTTGPVYGENARASWFSHKAEIAKPYYYRVYLASHDVVAEVTPTERAAMFRLTYPERDTSYLVIDAFEGGSYISVGADHKTITGYTTKNSGGVPEGFKDWFTIVSDTPFTFVRTVSDSVENNSSEVSSDHVMALVGFKTCKGQKVILKVSSSFISREQALLNMKELDGKSFDDLVASGRACWNEVLGRISVNDGDLDHLRTFYSCLYRSVLFPRDLSEINASGERVHYSPYNGKVLPGYMFTDTGFWDTFRSLFPLMNLVYPDQSRKVQEGLVNAYKESGYLPEWASPGHRGCMVGNNSASVVADAYLKGIRGYDAGTLWKAVVRDAHSVHPTISSTGRLGYEYYDSLGYVPCDVGIRESAARTLEYSYDDWCIYRFGKALGKSEEELLPYKKNAFNYRNLFDPDYNLMVGKKLDGKFNLPFNPLKWGGDFTEGNSLHYSWSVFHDPAGLISLMGGDAVFNGMMDTVFNMPPAFDASYYRSVIHEIREMQIMGMGNYAHGNQPIQHMIYLYDWSGRPWEAQARVREVMDKFYTAAPDGYCGDEDNGQTSAWYVFSALGFYPVCPGSNQYAIGTPLFKKVVITRPSGKKIIISAKNNSRSHYYISGMRLNGRKYSKTYLQHEDLVKGARIRFQMSDHPDTARGISVSDRPYSFSE